MRPKEKGHSTRSSSNAGSLAAPSAFIINLLENLCPSSLPATQPNTSSHKLSRQLSPPAGSKSPRPASFLLSCKLNTLQLPPPNPAAHRPPQPATKFECPARNQAFLHLMSSI